jgi:hypothetical protein
MPGIVLPFRNEINIEQVMSAFGGDVAKLLQRQHRGT